MVLLKIIFCGDVCISGADVAQETDEVASCYKYCSLWFLLLRYVFANNFTVCDIFYSGCWYFIVFQEKNCVGNIYYVSYSLLQVYQLDGKRYHPNFYAIVEFDEMYVL